MVRRGSFPDYGGRGKNYDVDDAADVGGRPGRSMRDIEAADAALNQMAQSMTSGSPAEQAFVRIMSQLSDDSPAPNVAAAAGVLRLLPPDRARELLDQANNPSVLERSFAGDADMSVGAEADPTADFAEAPPAEDPMRKSWAASDKDIKRDKVVAAQNAKKRAERAAAGKRTREPSIDSHPMDRPTTYGGARWGRDTRVETRSPGERYLNKPFAELSPGDQRQAMWLINPKLAQYVNEFQDAQLAGMRLDPQTMGMLSPTMQASILGVAPDQITPDLIGGASGMSLPQDVIDQMGYAQRDMLVGRPQLTPEQQAMVDRFQGDDFTAQVRATAPASRKVEKWLGMAGSGNPDNVPILDEDLPWWRASHPYYRPESMGLEYSPYAPTGEFLARLARVTHKYDDPSFITQVGPLFDRAIQQQADMPPMTTAGRGRKNTAAGFAGRVLVPEDTGLGYMKRFSGDNAPFQQFSDLLLNRGTQRELNLGNIEVDATMQPSLPAQDMGPVSMNTPEDMSMEPPVTPPEDDLAMMYEPLNRGRMNPSILAALLA